jgi:DNA-binding LacI/PurR family transcriptional regulator
MWEKQVDGLILVPASSQPTPYLENLVKQGIPLVLLDRTVYNLGVDAVMVDNENGAFQAVSHLINLGHQRIGMVIDNLDISTNAERLTGYRKDYNPLAFGEESLYNPAIYTAIGFASPLDGCYVARIAHCPLHCNNFMTIGVLQAIQQKNSKFLRYCPGRIDDLEWTALNYHSLQHCQPVYEMGSVAAQSYMAHCTEAHSMELRL